MDKEIMNKWIDLIPIPWKNTKVPSIVPFLILDAYRVHIMGYIVN